MSTVHISKKNRHSFPLHYRMAALNLDPIEISKIVPQTFGKMQRVCGSCKSQGRCEQDLEHHSGSFAWKKYCPNIADLALIDAVLRASGGE